MICFNPSHELSNIFSIILHWEKYRNFTWVLHLNAATRISNYLQYIIYGVFFLLRCRNLNILICNAAVLGGPYSTTEGGVEKTFVTNHLGHFYLAELLKDLLIKSAPSRVVVVSSESHRYSQKNCLYIILTWALWIISGLMKLLSLWKSFQRNIKLITVSRMSSVSKLFWKSQQNHRKNYSGDRKRTPAQVFSYGNISNNISA